jgi:hypothetical protein
MERHVLLIEDELSLQKQFLESLRTLPSLSLEVYSHGFEALPVLERTTPDLIVTTPSNPEFNALPLVREATRRKCQFPIIVTINNPNTYAHELQGYPNLTILEKPLSPMVLRAIVEEKLALQEKQSTELIPFHLVDYIQMAGMGKRSLLLRVITDLPSPGIVEIYKGDVWLATVGDVTGIDALLLLLDHPVHRITYSGLTRQPAERHFDQQWEQLLLDVARLYDESKRETEGRDSFTSMELSLLSSDFLPAVTAENSGFEETFENPPQANQTNEEFPASFASPPEHENTGQSTTIPPIQPEREMNMSNLNAVCNEVVDDVTDAIACAVVDLNSGMLMGVQHRVSYFTQTYLDAVAAAAVDMFRGKNVRRVEQLLSKHRGTEVKDTFQEIFINSTTVIHFMKLLPEKEVVVVLVTRKTTNQGMGWAGLRAGCQDILDSL